MMLKRFAVAALSAAVVVVPMQASAQFSCDRTSAGTCNVQQPLTVTVPYFARLNAASPATTIAAANWVDASESELSAGQQERTNNSIATVRVAANVPWSVTIAGAWNNSKPIGDVLWKAGVFPTGGTALSNTAATLISGGTPGGYDASGHAQEVSLLTTWKLTDPPGAYTLTITYVLTAS